jgi:hypothetical protein
MSDFFDYAETHRLALLPIPYGFKDDMGWKPEKRAEDPTLKPIVWRWSQECSTDRAQWQAWRDAHKCNFGIAAAASGCIAIDIDVSGDPDIWGKFCAFWTSRGITPPSPQFKSARDGWHVLVRVGDGVDANIVGQPDLMPNVNIRASGYVVAPESFYDGSTQGKASGRY